MPVGSSDSLIYSRNEFNLPLVKNIDTKVDFSRANCKTFIRGPEMLFRVSIDQAAWPFV